MPLGTEEELVGKHEGVDWSLHAGHYLLPLQTDINDESCQLLHLFLLMTCTCGQAESSASTIQEMNE